MSLFDTSIGGKCVCHQKWEPLQYVLSCFFLRSSPWAMPAMLVCPTSYLQIIQRVSSSKFPLSGHFSSHVLPLFFHFSPIFFPYWCLVGNGWEWGLLGLLFMVVKWIIPLFPTFLTSKCSVLILFPISCSSYFPCFQSFSSRLLPFSCSFPVIFFQVVLVFSREWGNDS